MRRGQTQSISAEAANANEVARLVVNPDISGYNGGFPGKSTVSSR